MERKSAPDLIIMFCCQLSQHLGASRKARNGKSAKQLPIPRSCFSWWDDHGCGSTAKGSRAQERQEGNNNKASSVHYHGSPACLSGDDDTLLCSLKIRARWRTPLIPALGRQTQADPCEFKASLVFYRVSSWTARATLLRYNLRCPIHAGCLKIIKKTKPQSPRGRTNA